MAVLMLFRTRMQAGLTAIDFPSYLAGSWLGMLPGTVWYVSAGSVGRSVAGAGGPLALLDGEFAAAGGDAGGLGAAGAGLAAGLLVSVLSAGYLGGMLTRVLGDEGEEGEKEGE